MVLTYGAAGQILYLLGQRTPLVNHTPQNLQTHSPTAGRTVRLADLNPQMPAFATGFLRIVCLAPLADKPVILVPLDPEYAKNTHPFGHPAAARSPSKGQPRHGLALTLPSPPAIADSA